jgi:hypothetical protein
MNRLLCLAAISLLLPVSRPQIKKEHLLKISKKYFPENYIVIKEYSEKDIEFLSEGDEIAEILADIPTIVHEGYHHFMNNHSSYYGTEIQYRINDSLSFKVANRKTFPSRELNAIVPDSLQKNIFRYKTYVDAKDDINVTQQFGLFGLIEEEVAYLQSFHTSVCLFNYCMDTYSNKNPAVWLDYLGNMGSYRYAVSEFELFISWYFQWSKKQYPQLYVALTGDEKLKALLKYIHLANKSLTASYSHNRIKILALFPDRLSVDGDFIYDNKAHSGKSLYDGECERLNRMLLQPAHAAFLAWLQ